MEGKVHEANKLNLFLTGLATEPPPTLPPAPNSQSNSSGAFVQGKLYTLTSAPECWKDVTLCCLGSYKHIIKLSLIQMVVPDLECCPWSGWLSLIQMVVSDPDGCPWCRRLSLIQMVVPGPDGYPWSGRLPLTSGKPHVGYCAQEEASQHTQRLWTSSPEVTSWSHWRGSCFGTYTQLWDHFWIRWSLSTSPR